MVQRCVATSLVVDEMEVDGETTDTPSKQEKFLFYVNPFSWG